MAKYALAPYRQRFALARVAAWKTRDEFVIGVAGFLVSLALQGAGLVAEPLWAAVAGALGAPLVLYLGRFVVHLWNAPATLAAQEMEALASAYESRVGETERLRAEVRVLRRQGDDLYRLVVGALQIGDQLASRSKNTDLTTPELLADWLAKYKAWADFLLKAIVPKLGPLDAAKITVVDYQIPTTWSFAVNDEHKVTYSKLQARRNALRELAERLEHDTKRRQS